jgi:uncharacterized protein
MKTEHVTNKGTQTTRIPNKLAEEKSPYLLQHAYNPVNWYSWGDEAFEKAKKENKPIFLSIGYSTCHWCHVMAHECFEDQEISELLNDAFICIKVDKEERPDIDTVYMTICQITTGQGGWPLTILMTPEQKPFFAGTYLPKNSRPAVLGLIDLLVQVKSDWLENPDGMIATGDKLADILKREFEASSDSAEVTKDLVNLAVTQMNQNFDHDFGGFGNEPKFPTPHNLMFLLRHAQLEADEKSLFMVENTLKHMYRGGIYDHVGYGFSRYSTDAKWLVPHFEKMLYDNALLAATYAETYQYTKDPLYRTVAEQIFEYIRREMTDPEGGFYCAQDADSEGVEGKYYTFTPEEIDNILDKDDASFFCEYFDITKEGNFEEGSSIPNLIKSHELKSDNEKVMRACNKVYSYRLDRARLHKDDKALTSWNALMIHAYATAARIFQNEDYVDVAKRGVEFINTRLTDPNGLLYVSYRDGTPAHFGLIDDYAFYGMALLSLYDVTFDIDYIHQTCTLADRMIELFWDKKYGGFFLNANDAEKLIYRPKEVYDGAIPSGNSVAAYVFQRLANLTANSHYMEYAGKQLTFLAGQVKDYPAGHSFALVAFLQALYPSKEIVCVVSENEDYKELSDYLAEHFEPNTTVLLKSEKNFEKVLEVADYVEDYRILNNKTTYYVCENHQCMAPVNELIS